MTDAPPLQLIRPTTPQQLADAIRAASTTNAQIQLTGSNSLPLTRFASDRPLQPISTLRLNKIIEHAVSDMTVIVEAGITLEALQKHLAWQNQWLPIDPPSHNGRPPGTRTLGGLIASNSLGPLRFGCAGALDWRLLILGMTWIDASGTLINGGGRTVKNVAGYSTPRLLIGSAGSLGAIATITLRTFTRPVDEQSVLFYCDSPQRADQLLSEILFAPATPACLEAIGAQTFAANPLQLPTPKSGIILAAGFLDRPPSCAAQIQTLRNLPAAQNLESIAQPAAPSGRLRLWLTTEPTSPSPTLALRIHALSSQTCQILATLESIPDTWSVAEAATALIRTHLPADAAPAIIQSLLAQFPGITLLPTQGTLPNPPATHPLTRQLKTALDPLSIFGHAPA